MTTTAAPRRRRTPRPQTPPESPPPTPAEVTEPTISSGFRKYEVVDLFCGAGGSSTGAQKAIASIGGTMRLRAVNHWPIAIETHQRNHPHALHYVQDVEQADPEVIVPGGYLDILMASPECKYHSRARGGKPVQDQGRMTAFAVMNWLTKINVRTVLIENVPEFVDWGPLDENMKPLRSKKGMHFQAWFMNFRNLGYHAEWKFLNAADYGGATTRTRFFLQARNDGLPIVWPEPSHSRHGEQTLTGTLPKWRGAREIIEWSNQGRSLLDDPKYHKKPLSIKTRRRIARGLQKYGGPLAHLYIRLLGLPEYQALSSSPTDMPFIVNHHGENGSLRCHDINDPTPTVTGRSAGYVLTHEAQPFTCANRSDNIPKPIDDPLAPITTTPSIFVVNPAAQPVEMDADNGEFLIGQQSGAAPGTPASPSPPSPAGAPSPSPGRSSSTTTPRATAPTSTTRCPPSPP